MGMNLKKLFAASAAGITAITLPHPTLAYGPPAPVPPDAPAVILPVDAAPILVAEPSPGAVVSSYDSINCGRAVITSSNAQCQCPRCCAERAGWWERYKAKKQEQYWGYPEYFHELPLGTLSTQILSNQVMRGERARLMLYDYDFVTGK